MTLNYFDITHVDHIIEELYELTFPEDATPFQSTILPICVTAITYVYNGKQSAIFNGMNMPLDGLIVTGQFYESYQFVVENSSQSFGICFHPTALYKIAKINGHKIKNKHLPLKLVSNSLHNILEPIFLDHKDNIPELIKGIKTAVLKLPILQNNSTLQVDNVIEIIKEKEGMLNTYELLDHINFSQKTLETHFKNIVGLTPGRYIRLYRFLKLMRKYEGKEIDLKDLIYMYNYYDHSHFVKDFKHFMKQSPKDYFKKDHPFLNEYLKE